MSEIKSLSLCHATAAESLSNDDCFVTCLNAARTYLMDTSTCLKQDISGGVGQEKKENNKWSESKMEEMGTRLRCEWERKVNEEKARKSDYKRNEEFCKSIHLGSLNCHPLLPVFSRNSSLTLVSVPVCIIACQPTERSASIPSHLAHWAVLSKHWSDLKIWNLTSNSHSNI